MIRHRPLLSICDWFALYIGILEAANGLACVTSHLLLSFLFFSFRIFTFGPSFRQVQLVPILSGSVCMIHQRMATPSNICTSVTIPVACCRVSPSRMIRSYEFGTCRASRVLNRTARRAPSSSSARPRPRCSSRLRVVKAGPRSHHSSTSCPLSRHWASMASSLSRAVQKCTTR